MTNPASDSREQYHWFHGASVSELVRRITLVGAENARLEVRVLGDKMYFRVKRAMVASSDVVGALPDINDSFLCPPICT